MSSYLLFFIFFIVTASGNVENNFILDFFNYKNVPSVVGYSCNTLKEDISLVKSFNNIGITASIKKLNYKHEIHRFAYSNFRKLGVFLDLRCYVTENIVSVFLEATNHRIFDELHNWLVFGLSVDEVARVINDDAFGTSTEFTIAVPSSVGGYKLYDTYNPWKERGSKLNITFMGFWEGTGRLNVTLQGTKFSRRSNLFGVTLKAFFFASPYKPVNTTLVDYLQDYATASKDGLSKFGFNVIVHVAELFNLTLQEGEVAVWEAGDPTGPLIRALNKNQVDLSGSLMSMNVPRTYLVKYIHQSWPFRTCFIFRSPQPKKKRIKLIEVLKPLEMEVWYLLIVLLGLFVWTMAFAFRYEHLDVTFMRYSNAILLTLGAICQQGSDVEMNRMSTRIALLCIMIFSYLFCNYYSASVVSVRLNEPIFKINDSLNELAKTDLKVASESMVYLEFFIKKDDWETKSFYAKRWAHLTDEQRFMEPEKAMRMAQEGGFAYHTHPEVAYPIVNRLWDNREICEMTEVHLGHPILTTFALKPNSSIIDMMRIGFTKMAEVGIRKRQEKRWSSPKPVCRTDVLSASSVNMYEFAPQLLILLFGMVLSAIVYYFEKKKIGKIETKSKKEKKVSNKGWKFWDRSIKIQID